MCPEENETNNESIISLKFEDKLTLVINNSPTQQIKVWVVMCVGTKMQNQLLQRICFYLPNFFVVIWKEQNCGVTSLAESKLKVLAVSVQGAFSAKQSADVEQQFIHFLKKLFIENTRERCISTISQTDDWRSELCL